MRIAIHQKSFLPYPGWFAKVLHSDQFLDLGGYQFSPNEMYHRTFMQTGKYLTVPVIKEKDTSINNIKVRVDDLPKFADQILTYLRSYKGSLHYKEIMALFDMPIKDLKDKKFNTLQEVIDAFNKPVLEYLGLDCKIISNVNFNPELGKTDLLLDLLKQQAENGIYVSGGGARVYLDTELLESNGFSTEFQSRVNPDSWGCSIVHYLFHFSKEEILIKLKEDFSFE
jgi:hypothetical protein